MEMAKLRNIEQSISIAVEDNLKPNAVDQSVTYNNFFNFQFF